MATKDFRTRETLVWTPALDTLGTLKVRGGTGNPLTVVEHDDVHKYLYLKSAIANLNDVALGVPATGHTLVYSGTKWVNRVISGDGTIDGVGALTISSIGGDSVVLGGTLTTSNAFTTAGGILTLTVVGATNVTLPLAGTLLANDLLSGHVWIGSAGNVAVARQFSGVITLSNIGATDYVALSITNAAIASATIAWTKLATGTASRIAITDGGGVLITADTATYPSLAELAYVKGVTSAIQTQINNIISGATTLTEVNVGVGHINLSGNRITLDADENTYIYSPSDDRLDIVVNGFSDFWFGANIFTVQAGSSINLNSNNLTFSAGTYMVSSFVNTLSLFVNSNANITFSDGTIELEKNMLLDLTTFNLEISANSGAPGNILIGGALDLVGFYNTVPVVQPTVAGTGDALFAANTSAIVNDTATWGGWTIGKITQALLDLGLLA